MIQLLILLGAPETSPPVLEISVKLANLFAIMDEAEKRQQAEVGYKFAIDSQKKTVEQILELVEAGEDIPETAVKDAKALLGWAHQSYAFFLLGRCQMVTYDGGLKRWLVSQGLFCSVLTLTRTVIQNLWESGC